MIRYYNASEGARIEIADRAFYIVGPERAILVLQPEYWGWNECQAFFDLMEGLSFSIETHQLVALWLKGDVLIVQPAIEVRSMANFVPFLIKCVMPGDRDEIEKFFLEYPLVGTEDIPIN